MSLYIIPSIDDLTILYILISDDCCLVFFYFGLIAFHLFITSILAYVTVLSIDPHFHVRYIIPTTHIYHVDQCIPFLDPLSLLTHSCSTLDIVRPIAYEIFWILCILHTRAGELIIRYLSLVFFRFYYLFTLSLHYGLSRKTTLSHEIRCYLHQPLLRHVLELQRI